MNGQQSVEYIDHMGDDLSVVNAARVSIGKSTTATTTTTTTTRRYGGRGNQVSVPC